MIRRLDLRGRALTRAQFAGIVPRPESDPVTVGAAVSELLADVRERGEAALLDQAERYDRVRPAGIRVPHAEIEAAVDSLPTAVRDALQEAIVRVRAATDAQLPRPAVTEYAPGASVEQRWQPVGRVGFYVPGGKAVYPSSVVMSVVPAQQAGVRAVVLASPPQAEFGGSVHPVILGAAGLLGVADVFAMGGAGAIGALAYGVPEAGLEPVDVVTGPGNVFVAAAKRLVKGVVGIDAEAGPTEILIIADASADARLVAADLVSQAEHDELAAAVLVTDAPGLADAVDAELASLVPAARHRARVEHALNGPQSAIVLVDDLPTAAAFSDAYGPEHLEIHTADPDAVLVDIHDAGAIFLGPHAPVSLGDYLAGSNHVLPTGGQARFSAGLNATTFLRSQQIIRYDAAGLAAVAPHIRALSDAEDLPSHGDAVDARVRREPPGDPGTVRLS